MQKTVREGMKFQEKAERIIYTVDSVYDGIVRLSWKDKVSDEHYSIADIEAYINSDEWEILDYGRTERQTAEALLKEYNDFVERKAKFVIPENTLTDFLTSKYGKG